MEWENKTILLTGGTGSFGQKFTEIMMRDYKPRIIRIFSRDELKQWEMNKRFEETNRLRYFLGDIRDKERLARAMDGADIVIHAAALKQVPLCEYNPFEAVKTNILGMQNIVEAAIDHNIEKALAISTDKAVNPVNLYGSTKMAMEKLTVAANSYVGTKRKTALSCVRYGNVVGSRGSVIPLFNKQKESGCLTITDKRMTRFWITLEQGVKFVIKSVELMKGGEIFVPKIPSMNIIDLAETIAPGCGYKYIGIRPGEKLHECLLTEDESRHALEFPDFYLIQPDHPWWKRGVIVGGKPVKDGFRYVSSENDDWVDKKELKKMLGIK